MHRIKTVNDTVGVFFDLIIIELVIFMINLKNNFKKNREKERLRKQGENCV